MILKLEGHRDLPNATIEDVVRAVYALARPNGPTWVIVNDGGESYAQAAEQEAAGHAASDASLSPGPDQAEERPPQPPGAETEQMASQGPLGPPQNHQKLQYAR